MAVGRAGKTQAAAEAIREVFEGLTWATNAMKNSNARSAKMQTISCNNESMKEK
ncbi:hypothetical protein KIN20_018884 [Parelaphostrongylus tenuis]|uniref:Uncharacterized protein n=1 Tax=Parelaphostrongylus tenuis TaxID=148309 RepID=A0AAD5MNN2_PARTN|nr:hypothetical protein KIN20_018884 [Parelaphostrongylus tenuis]